jgi:hypothetical protein
MRAVLLSVLLLTACKREDPGPKTLAQAKASYLSLVEKGARPTDPAFDPVISQLETVSADSAARTEAQDLLRSLKRSRGNRPGLPLATPPKTNEPDVAAKQAECERLVRALPDAGDRAAAEKAVAVCRSQVHALEELHHAHQP